MHLKQNNQHISDVFFAEGLIPRKLDAAASFTDAFNPDAVP